MGLEVPWARLEPVITILALPIFLLASIHEPPVPPKRTSRKLQAQQEPVSPPGGGGGGIGLGLTLRTPKPTSFAGSS